MLGINYFVFDGIRSEEYGVIMTEPRVETFAERDVELVTIPGRSGDLVLDNGRFKNVKVSYQCAILPKEWETLREAVNAFLGKLKQVGGYARLYDSYNPGTFRLAMLTEEVSMASIAEQAGEFAVAFECKAPKYWEQGDTPVVLDAPASVFNDFGYTAKPIITVYGAGAGTLTVGGVMVEIKALEDQITLDCDQMNAYRKIGEAPAQNKNSAVKAWEFPELRPGENVVSWTGGIKRIEIIPRWWSL